MWFYFQSGLCIVSSIWSLYQSKLCKTGDSKYAKFSWVKFQKFGCEFAIYHLEFPTLMQFKKAILLFSWNIWNSDWLIYWKKIGIVIIDLLKLNFIIYSQILSFIIINCFYMYFPIFISYWEITGMKKLLLTIEWWYLCLIIWANIHMAVNISTD